MNLIRNGGFEESTLLHWEMVTPGDFARDTANAYRGVACGRLTSSGVAQEYFENMDYVDVEPDQLLTILAYIKSGTARGCRMHVLEYDEDLNLISNTLLAQLTFTAAYLPLKADYSVSAQGVYLRVRLLVQASSNGETFYFDDIQIRKHDTSTMLYSEDEIADINSATVSGTTAGDKRDKKGFATYIADIYVSIATGSSRTLDVTVLETDLNGRPVIVGTFAQKTGTTSERIALSNVLGRQMYVEYAIGGTTPLFSFKVVITGVR